MVTNKYLAEAYRKLNKKYFRNRLPKDMVVRFNRFCCDKLCQESCGETMFRFGRPLYILINCRLKWQSMLVDMTLIHEMVHVAIPNAEGHGPAFQREMLRLARLGAFRHLW